MPQKLWGRATNARNTDLGKGEAHRAILFRSKFVNGVSGEGERAAIEKSPGGVEDTKKGVRTRGKG